MSYRSAALLLCSALLYACEPGDRAGGSHFDGFVRLEAVAETRIGDVDDPEVGFSRIGGVDVDRDGNVYVLEVSGPEIRVYGSDTRLIRTIGRAGEGPGEFVGAPRFGVLGDTVWAFDSRNMRITLFRRDGTLLSTGRTEGVRVALPASSGWLLPYAMRPDGTFISHFGRISYRLDEPASGVQPTDSIPVPFVRFDTNGEVIDTIGWAPHPPPRMWRPPGLYDTEQRSIEVGGRRVSVPRAPAPMPSWIGESDGYVLVETPIAETAEEGVLIVTRFDVDGDTVYTRTLRYRPDPYSEETLDSIAVRAARGEAGGMVPYSPERPPPPDWQAVARVLREEMDFPPFQLPIQYPWVAQDGSVWLRRWDGTAETAEWFVLDPSGNPKGVLELPSGTRPLWNVGDLFWAVEYDQYEVPWLVRYRI